MDVPGPEQPPTALPPHAGHRERLRQRFLRGDGESVADYELLELLLFYAIDRRDVKPLAKALLDEFGSLGAVLGADPARLTAKDKLIGPRTLALFKAIREVNRRCLRADVQLRPVISSSSALLDYCRAMLADQPVENFHVLFLDRKNRLIADERQQRGTVDHTPVYPREVIKRALELGASALILVHNHPSGDPTPSAADIEMTREVRDVAAKLGIALHDHVIVGRGRASSLKGLGIL